MKYQLVVQFEAISNDHFDRLVVFEDLLIEALDASEEVDGHDFGSGEFNLFVHTDQPRSTFQTIKSLVESQQIEFEMRAAYRDFKSEEYTILWPPALKEFRVV